MPLSDAQIAQLSEQIDRRLRVLEDEIARKLGQTTDEIDGIDSGELSALRVESEVDLSEALRDIDEWRGLRAALRRVEEGSYGVCADCGCDIPFERLVVQPLAQRCVTCQDGCERRERRLHPSL